MRIGKIGVASSLWFVVAVSDPVFGESEFSVAVLSNSTGRLCRVLEGLSNHTFGAAKVDVLFELHNPYQQAALDGIITLYEHINFTNSAKCSVQFHVSHPPAEFASLRKFDTQQNQFLVLLSDAFSMTESHNFSRLCPSERGFFNIV